MDLSLMLVALLVCTIICVVGAAFIKIAKPPEPVSTIVWAIVAIICLVVLINALTGRGLGLTL